MSRHTIFHLLFYDGITGSRTDSISLDPTVTSGVITTALPGGYQDANFGFESVFYRQEGNELVPHRTRYFPRKIQARHLGHLEVLVGSDRIWEGRIKQLTYLGAEIRGVICEGYGLALPKDDFFFSNDKAKVSAATVLRRVMQTAAPSINVPADTANQFQDPGVFHSLTEYDGQRPAQVIEQLTRQGSDANILFDFGCYKNRTAFFKARTLIGNPDYQVDFEQQTTNIQELTDELYGAVAVKYVEPGTNTQKITSWIEDPTFKARYGGILRRNILDAGNVTQESAYQHGRTYLAQHKNPIITGTLTRDDYRGVRLFNSGSHQLQYMVQSGQWVKIGDSEPLIIIRTEANLHEGKLSVELNQKSPSIPNLLQDLRDKTSNFVAGVNPISGGKR